MPFFTPAKLILLAIGLLGFGTTSTIVGTYVSSNNRITNKTPYFNPYLTNDPDNFLVSFNYPGDCIKKLFPKVEKSDFFNRKRFYRVPIETYKEHQAFNNTANAPTLACYTFNKESDYSFRLELAVEGNTEGWLWIAGYRLEEDKPTLWYKEAIVNKHKGLWTVVVGHEGIIPKTKTYTPAFPKFKSEFRTESVYLDNLEPCEDDCEYSGKLAYWKPSPTKRNNNLNSISSNIGSQITTWSTTSKDLRQKPEYRKNIFYENTWYRDKGEPNEVRSIIKVEDSNLANKQGSWFDLSEYCKEDTKTELFQKLCL